MKSGCSQPCAWTFIWLSVAWAIVVVIGLASLFNYQTSSGAVGIHSERWPVDSEIVPAEDRLHLVMAIHPYCPCSRASLEALDRIMAHSQGRANASVLFMKPNGVRSGWEQTELWHNATAIPGVDLICDEGGQESRRFGVETSGHVLLYDKNGKQLYSGGITAGRGHHGDNAGLDRCMRFISGEKTDPQDAPVFGCSLFNPAVCDVEGENTCRKTN